MSNFSTSISYSLQYREQEPFFLSEDNLNFATKISDQNSVKETDDDERENIDTKNLLEGGT